MIDSNKDNTNKPEKKKPRQTFIPFGNIETDKKLEKVIKKVQNKQLMPKSLVVDGDIKILMPFVVAIMRSDLSKIQQDVILSIIEKIGGKIRAVLNKEVEKGMEMSLFAEQELDDEENTVKIQIYLKEFGVSKSHFPELRSALRMLAAVPVEIPFKSNSGRDYDKFTNFCDVYIPKDVTYNQYCIVSMKQEVAQKLLNLDFGHLYVGKKTSRSMKTKYSERLYWYIKAYANLGGVTLPVSELKKMIGVENKYKDFTTLEKRVLIKSQEEILSSFKEGTCECYFTYEKVWNNGRNRGTPDVIVFKILSGNHDFEKELVAASNNLTQEFVSIMVEDLGISQTVTSRIANRITPEFCQTYINKALELKALFDDKQKGGTIPNKMAYVVKSFNNLDEEIRNKASEKKAEDDNTNIDTIEKWNRCISEICSQLSDEEVALTFGVVRMISYNDNNLLVSIPNRQVYDRIENEHVTLFGKYIRKHFGNKTILRYKIG